MKRLLILVALSMAAACGNSEVPAAGADSGLAPEEDGGVIADAGGLPDAGPLPDGGEQPDAGVNHAPAIDPIPDVSITEGETQSLELSASDPDGDELGFSLVGDDLPSWVSLDGDTLAFAPGTGDAGTVVVTVSVSDGQLSAEESFTVTVRHPVVPVTGSITLNDGAALTRSAEVSARIEALCAEGAMPVRMRFSTDGSVFGDWEPFTDVREGLLLDASSDGTKTLWVEVEDDFGNTGVLSDEIILDTTAPQAELLIDAGAETTRTQTVELSVTTSDANGVVEVCYSNDGATFSGCAAPTATAAWLLDPVDGERTVTIRVTDSAGNQALAYDTIVLDSEQPTVSVVINGGADFTNSFRTTLTVTAEDAFSGVAELSLSSDNAIWGPWEPFDPAPIWMLSGGDGLKTVFAKVRDRAGNESAVAFDEITLDATPPIGSLRLNLDDAYTSTVEVLAAVESADSGSGVASLELSNDGSTWSAPEPPYTSKAWTLESGDGPKRVFLRIADYAGNEAVVDDTIELDTTPPAVSLAINGGAGATNLRQVELTFSATDLGSGIEYRRIYEGAAVLEPASSPVAYALSDGDGGKLLELEAADRAGNIAWTSATIVLDTVAPSLSYFAIASGAEYVNTTSVLADSVASDGSGSGVAEICIGPASMPVTCQPYLASAPASLTSGDGLKTLYARVKDRAGNYSGVLSDTVTLDTVPPQLTSLLINGGATYATVRDASIATTAADATGISFSTDGGASWSDWQPWAAALTFVLPQTDAEYTVIGRARDRAGNISPQPYPSDAIILDTTAPTGTVTIDSGADFTNETPVALTLSATDNLSGVARYCVKSTNARPNASDPCWRQPFAVSMTWTLPAGDGAKSVYAWFMDDAGWISASASDSIYLDTLAPNQPTGVAVGEGHRELEVSWAPGFDAGSGLGDWTVQLSLDGATWADAASTSQRTALLTGLPNGLLRYLRIIASDRAGNVSTPSAAVTGTPRFPFVERQRRPTARSLRDVELYGASSAVLVGEGGMVLATADRGATFTRRDPMVDVDLNAIAAAASGTTLIAVGAGGTVVISSDTGRTWRSSTTATAADLFDVAFAGGAIRRWAAVGADGIWTSSGSLSFDLARGTSDALRAIAWSATAGTLVATGDAGSLWSSSDGAAWSVRSPPAGYATADFKSLASAPSSSTMFLGCAAPAGRSALLRSTNGGLAWAPVEDPNTVLLRDLTIESISAISATELIVAGSKPGQTDPVLIAIHADPADPSKLAATAVALPSGYAADGHPTGPIHGVRMFDGTSGMAVGAEGQILATSGTGTWIARTGGSGADIQDLAFADALSGYAVTTDGFSLRTTDGGASWQRCDLSGVQVAPPLYGMAAPALDTVLGVGGGGKVFKQQASGLAVWDLVATPVASDLFDIDCIIRTDCIAVGADSAVVEYSGGSNWTTRNLSAGGATLRGVAFYTESQRHAIAVGDGGALITMTNDQWSNRPPIAGAPNLKAVDAGAFGALVVAVGNGGVILRSTDDGLTWTAASSGTTENLRSVSWAGGPTWYAIGGSAALRSDDDGLTWRLLAAGHTSAALNSVFTTGDSSGDVWIAGASGAVLFSATGGE